MNRVQRYSTWYPENFVFTDKRKVTLSTVLPPQTLLPPSFPPPPNFFKEAKIRQDYKKNQLAILPNLRIMAFSSHFLKAIGVKLKAPLSTQASKENQLQLSLQALMSAKPLKFILGIHHQKLFQSKRVHAPHTVFLSCTYFSLNCCECNRLQNEKD